jgi:hypothetical protein
LAIADTFHAFFTPYLASLFLAKLLRIIRHDICGTTLMITSRVSWIRSWEKKTLLFPFRRKSVQLSKCIFRESFLENLGNKQKLNIDFCRIAWLADFYQKTIFEKHRNVYYKNKWHLLCTLVCYYVRSQRKC